MRILKYIDKISERTGIVAAWLVVPLMVVVVQEVLRRYVFNAPTGWGYDTCWMLYGALFAIGGAYTLLHRRHVRIDVIHHLLPLRGRAIFDAVFYIVVFLPVMALLTVQGVKFAARAWATGEKLSTTVWFFPSAPIKTVIPLAFFLLGLQGVAELVRNFMIAKKGKKL